MRYLTTDDLRALAIGAAFLGAGGGGDPYIGTLMARQALTEHGPVAVFDPSEIPDDALCVMSAVMGAPTVLVEKLPEGREQLRALHTLEGHLGHAITHVMCAEVGGLNSTLPIVAAARSNLPLVDCDAMGRAFPELQMSTPTLDGIGAAPMVLADDKGNTVTLDAVDNHWAERIARSVTVDMGASAFIALFAQSGSQVKQSMIPGTLRLAQRIGDAVIDARLRKDDAVAAAIAASGGFRLFSGRIDDVERRTEAGFARGAVSIVGIGDDSGRSLDVRFQNENLIAQLDDGRVLATVPDLVVLLETETGQPVTTEELRYGYRVTAVGVPCDRRWRTPAGIELVGPRYFGLDRDYVPVESLMEGDAP